MAERAGAILANKSGNAIFYCNSSSQRQLYTSKDPRERLHRRYLDSHCGPTGGAGIPYGRVDRKRNDRLGWANRQFHRL